MAYCKECGARLRAKAKFCPNCGTQISAEAPKVLEEPKTKPTKVEIAEVKEIDHTSRLMKDLKFGIVFIVMGFLAKLLITNIFAKKITDSGSLISFGNWALILFGIIGIYMIFFGIADYAIARKKIEPHKMMVNLRFGIAFIVVGFMARLFLTNVVAKESTDVAKLISFSDWLLALFVIVGIVIICFGIADYAIARKKTEPPKMIINLKFGMAFILVGFLIRLYLTNVAAKGSTDAGTIISVGNFLLILFVIIGLLTIGFGIAEYAIAKKRK